MSGDGIPGTNGNPGAHEQVRAIAERYAGEDRSAALALLALVRLADEDGARRSTTSRSACARDYLAAVRAEGRDADAEAGRLSLDEVRLHLANVVVPRLVGSGAIEALGGDPEHSRLRIAPALWGTVRALRGELRRALRETGEFAAALAAARRRAARVEGQQRASRRRGS